jgi:hypothetical protein
VDHPQVALQSVASTVVPQALDVFGISVKGDNTALVPHEPGRSQSDASNVCADIVDDITRPNHSQNCILYKGFMLSAPEERLSGESNLYPQPLRQARLNLHPVTSFSEKTVLDQPLELIDRSSHTGPLPQGTFRSRFFNEEVNPIKQGIEAAHLMSYSSSLLVLFHDGFVLHFA